MRTALTFLFVLVAAAAERSTDPTFLRHHIPTLPANDLTPTCHYKPAFTSGGVIRGVARFGELTLDSGAACPSETLPAEEQAWVVLDGACTLHYGDQQIPLRRHDFF